MQAEGILNDFQISWNTFSDFRRSTEGIRKARSNVLPFISKPAKDRTADYYRVFCVIVEVGLATITVYTKLSNSVQHGGVSRQPLNADVQKVIKSVTSRLCAVCEAPAKSKCSRCDGIYYCGSDCQKTDWTSHKTVCRQMQLGKAQADSRSLTR